ncbi:MAG: glycosyltransferase [Leptodesmis sp.]|uniref:glycosyltransferase n=1 Tax=Leptodesmis sp. TaxID=3100501 RepID=UPI003D0FEC3F
METVLNPSRPCSLLIIIVNYRTARLTIDCLRSLEHEVRSQPGTQVVVVDNASGDQSVDAIQAAITQHHWQDWVTLLPSSRNGGYAYGNNLAIRPTLRADNPPSYYLLLNPDTQVRPGALKALVDFMEQHPTVGIAGSSFENQEGQQRIMAGCMRLWQIWPGRSDTASGVCGGSFNANRIPIRLICFWILYGTVCFSSSGAINLNYDLQGMN